MHRHTSSGHNVFVSSKRVMLGVLDPLQSCMLQMGNAYIAPRLVIHAQKLLYIKAFRVNHQGTLPQRCDQGCSDFCFKGEGGGLLEPPGWTPSPKKGLP